MKGNTSLRHYLQYLLLRRLPRPPHLKCHLTPSVGMRVHLPYHMFLLISDMLSISLSILFAVSFPPLQVSSRSIFVDSVHCCVPCIYIHIQ